MHVYRSISEFRADKKTVLTLGTFDGVHTGHRKIIERLIADARAKGAESLILTFYPHPRFVVGGHADFHLLNTQEEKIGLLEETGLDHLIIHPFDSNFSQLSAADFVKSVLVDQLNVGKIIIGHDHRFGKGRTAGIHDLIDFGKIHHFDVEQIGPQEVDAVSVSSTKIRKALEAGDIATANAYLGYPYLLSGTVVEGQKLGRTIGFPTANLAIPEAEKLIPRDGVYVVRCDLDGQTVFGMMNIGFRPTVNGQDRSIEVHFLDTDANLYGKSISLNVLHRLRDEQKFPSVDVLKSQLLADLDATRSFIKSV